MPFKQMGSAHAKYLATTDVLIGDMSNTNYEFLLYDKPVILLANGWLRENFPDIGIKTDLAGLSDAIDRSVKNPDEFKEARKYWLDKTIYKPDGLSSKRYIDIMLSKCQIEKPRFVFIHGNDSVRKTNLQPLVKEVKRRGLKTRYMGAVTDASDDAVYVGAHFCDLLGIEKGYKVHIDHDLKGKATNNIEEAIKDQREQGYLPLTDLYIVAGEAGSEYTRTVLGPLHDRRVIAGYPKADDFLKLNTAKNKKAVFKQLGFDINKPLVTYAPAGIESYMKPGGSLREEVIEKLKEISQKSDYNILVKLKYPGASFPVRLLVRSKRLITGMLGAIWPE